MSHIELYISLFHVIYILKKIKNTKKLLSRNEDVLIMPTLSANQFNNRYSSQLDHANLKVIFSTQRMCKTS